MHLSSKPIHDLSISGAPISRRVDTAMSSKRNSLHRRGPSGGISGGSSRREDRTSDSGFGSLSDTESMVAHPDEDLTASPPDLQEPNTVDYWKTKYKIAQEDLSKKHKELQEARAQRQADTVRLEELDDLIKQLKFDNAALLHDNKLFRNEIKELLQGRGGPEAAGFDEAPVMSGAVGGGSGSTGRPGSSHRDSGEDSQRPTLRRATSTRRSRDAAAREKEEEKSRLAQRFSRDDSSQTSSQQRRSRAPYIEPLGPGGRRSSSVAPPTTRGGGAAATSAGHQVNYTTARDAVPVYSSTQTPLYGTVPRTVPSSSRRAEPDDYFAGTYQGHNIPLPEKKRERHSRR